MNSLRNQIAHSLEYKEEYVIKIIEAVKIKYKDLGEDLPLNIGLRMSIGFICGYIAMSHNLAKAAYADKILIDTIRSIDK